MTRLLFVLGATCAAVFAAMAAPTNTAEAPTVVETSATPVATSLVHEGLNAEEKPCARTTFKTQLVKNACAKGGQKAAKKALQAWVKANKVAYKEKTGKGLTCKTCHSKLGGDFPLNGEGLKIFKEYGGK